MIPRVSQSVISTIQEQMQRDDTDFLSRLQEKYAVLQPELTESIIDQAVVYARHLELDPESDFYRNLITNMVGASLNVVESIYAQAEAKELEEMFS